MRYSAHAPLGTEPAANNRLLSRLVLADDVRMLPVEYVRLSPRRVLLEAGERVSYLYFPVCGAISLVQVDPRGAMPEITTIGAEGMLGVTALLGADTARHRWIVQSAGAAYRAPLMPARAAFAHSKPFQALALEFADLLVAQLSQTVLCKLAHTVEQQLCQWLLLYAARAQGETLETTQEQIADALGSRRQGVTEAARKLQEQKAIAYSRGRITLLDRTYLERSACECYGIIARRL